MKEELIEQVKDYIATELNKKSCEIIKVLSKEYEDRMSNYKNELISNIVSNISIRYSESHERDLTRLQIEVINKFKVKE